MKITANILYIIIFCVSTSCVDPVQLEVAGEEKFLVIEGQITNLEFLKVRNKNPVKLI